jgi:hypothetical protein
VEKESSRLMRALGWLVRPINQDFMGDYATTLGSTVYMPKALLGTVNGETILYHEAVHVGDWRRWNVLMSLSYVFPPAILTFRALWEWRGYKESLRQDYRYFGPAALSDGSIEFYVNQFCGSAYFWMFPFRKTVRGWFQRWREELLRTEKPFSAMPL